MDVGPWSLLADAAKSVLTSCKHVAEVVSLSSDDPDLILASCSSASLRMSDLSSLVASLPSSEFSSALLDSVSRVNRPLTDLLRHAKSVYANPYDYMSKQSFESSVKDLTDSVKDLLSAAEPLKSAGNPHQSLTSPKSTPNYKNDNDLSSRLMADVGHLVEMASGGDQKRFVEGGQRFVASFRAMYALAKSLRLKNAADNFRDCGTMTLSLANVTFKSPGDSGAKSQLQSSVARLIDATRLLYYAITHSPGYSSASSSESTAAAVAALAPPSPPPAAVKPDWQYPEPVASPRPSASSGFSTTIHVISPKLSSSAPPPTPADRPFAPISKPPSARPASVASVPTLVVTQQGTPPANPAGVRRLLISVETQTDESTALQMADLARERADLEEERSKVSAMRRETERAQSDNAALREQLTRLQNSTSSTPQQRPVESGERASLERERAELSRELSEREAALATERKLLEEQRAHLARAQDEIEREKTPTTTATTSDGGGRHGRHHRRHNRASSSSDTNDPPSNLVDPGTKSNLLQSARSLVSKLQETFPKFHEEWSASSSDSQDLAVASLIKILMEVSSDSAIKTPRPSSVTSEPPSSSTSPGLPASSAPACVVVSREPSLADLNTERRVRRDMKNMLLVKGSALDFGEWQQLLTKFKLSRRFANSDDDVSAAGLREEQKQKIADRESHFERVVEAASALSAGLIDTLIAVATCVAQPTEESLHRAARESLVATRRQLVLLMAVVRIKVAKEVTGDDLAGIEKLYRENESEVSATAVDGKPDDAVIAAAGIAGHAQQLIVGDLERVLYDTSSRLRLLLTQLLAIVSTLNTSSVSASYLLEMSATALSTVQTLSSLSDVMETTKYLKISEPTKDELLPALVEEDQDEGLWDELLGTGGQPTPQYIIEEDNKPRYATLNKLIEMLTSPKSYYNNNFLKTFVMTSSSFTTPAKLLEKLVERYFCPPQVSPTEKQTIQMRVTILIKYWVETQYHEFDDNVIQKLRDFEEQTLPKDGYGTVATLLKSELDRKGAERLRKTKSLLIPPTDVFVPEEKRSPVSFVLAFDDAEIARQMTIIDFRIFAAIEPKELLDQAWNRPKLQHRAPNVRQLIGRANLIGHWVCRLVLWPSTHAERVAVVSKLMRVATTLRDLGNFNTLMAFIVGFNMSPITRLAKTMADVDPALVKSFKALEKLMSFNSSFKTYRQVVTQATNPTVPYIGVYLGDLTFIDEGNPDMVNGMINFEKREMVYRVIDDLRNYQHKKYPFPAVEPLYTFLYELPAASEKDLYAVSLQREPREVSASTAGGGDKRLSISTTKGTTKEPGRMSIGGGKVKKLA